MKMIKEVPVTPTRSAAVRRILLGGTLGLAVGFSTGHVGGCGSSVKPDSKCDDCFDDMGKAVWTCTTGANIYKGIVCMPANSVGTAVIAECNSAYIGFSWQDPVLWPCDGLVDGSGEEADAGADAGADVGGEEADTSGGGGADTTCNGWNPGAAVTLVGSTRYVDQAFIDDLIDEPYLTLSSIERRGRA